MTDPVVALEQFVERVAALFRKERKQSDYTLAH